MKGNVPNIVGFTLGEAENILKENKLSLGNIKYEYSDTYNEGIVIAQDPKSGSESNQEWETVNVVVSKGQKQEEIVQPPVEEEVPEEEIQPPTTTPDNSQNGSSGVNNGITNENINNNTNNGNTNNEENDTLEENENQDTETDASEITNDMPQPESSQSE